MSPMPNRGLALIVPVSLIVLALAVFPPALRVAAMRALTGLAVPGRTVSDWFMLRSAAYSQNLNRAATIAEARDLRSRYEARHRTLLYGQPCEGVWGDYERLYRIGADIALRGRYVPLNRLVPAPVLGHPASPYTLDIRIGCGRQDGIRADAPVFDGEGHLVGVTTAVSLLTSAMLPLSAPNVRVYCDVLGPQMLQGVLAGPWPEAGESAGARDADAATLQMTSRGIRPALGAQVFTAACNGAAEGDGLPAALPVGRISEVQMSADGFVRARVELCGVRVPGTVFVPGTDPPETTIEDHASPEAVRARYRAELWRLLLFRRLHIPVAFRECQRVHDEWYTGSGTASVVFAVGRRLPTADAFYSWVLPSSPDSLSLPDGAVCLQGDSLIGVITRDVEDVPRCHLLTSAQLSLAVDVIQPDNVSYRGILAKAVGPDSGRPVPEDWVLPAQPRLQLVSLENAGRPIVLPAKVVTASGGGFDLPPGIPVGRLISDRDDDRSVPWEVVPFADLSVLNICSALVPDSAVALRTP